MSVTPPRTRLDALTAAGTSVWLDQIRRSLIESGELRRLMEEDSLRGVTANPTIFEKAILGSEDYDAELRELPRRGLDSEEVYDAIAIQDVRMACDVLRPVFEESGRRDGFVSLEVAPSLAHDGEGTLAAAREYWGKLDRPNAMIKVPGTPEGTDAIEAAIAEGINVNVTLLFAVEAYERAAEAYLRGLERRRERGESLEVRSVASFFVSRVDAEVDRRLEALGREDLAGTAALANARVAYGRFKAIFGGERFARLREHGAAPQRPLWASTAVKSPHYPDTMYVDGLVAPDTVNTMPMPTLLAAADHAEVSGPTADPDWPGRTGEPAPEEALERLAEVEIDMAEVTTQLLREGVEAFALSMRKLLAGVESRREAIVTGRPDAVRSILPDELEPGVAARVRRAGEDRVVERLWRRDASLWGGGPEIAERLGWLTVTEHMLESVEDLVAFAEDCRAGGLTDAVVLGMGGSSLAPEVLRRSFSSRARGLRLHVLDSTDPAAVLGQERRLDLTRTLFLVSTKSGGTVETLSLYRYFRSRVEAALGDGEEAGRRFCAITDSGSPLEELAAADGFRRVFRADPSIGGRYSALSHFGMVPAALMGAGVRDLLESAQVAEQACAPHAGPQGGQGLWLGSALGALAEQGRDKLTLVVEEPIGSFGLWAEQLVAESLGKHGKGVVPVAGEPLGEPGAYGADRVFLHVARAEGPDPAVAERLQALAGAGHPVIAVQARGPEDLGRLFFVAEFATAVTGWALGVNPFDQPNVQEAKDRTGEVLGSYAEQGALPEVTEAGEAELRELLGHLKPPHYFAVMAYAEPSAALDRAMDRLRAAVRDTTGVATTFGYGPRFLHSTGQLHKGGPPDGVFLQLLHDGPDDIGVPGAGHSFATLKNAQALGDLEALRGHGLPAARLRLDGDAAEAAERLATRVAELLGRGGSTR